MKKVDTTIMAMEEMEDSKDRFLTFDLGTEQYGIVINQVTEIIGLQAINRLPETPDYIQGVINLRGKIIPVIDLGMKFRRVKRDYTDRTCIIVVETQHLTAGLVVDNVDEVILIKDISPPPDLAAGIGSRYIQGIGKVNEDIVILIDCERFFNDEETLSLKSAKIID
jgi:purine-binding chemotaxis protein CheW